jgi:SNF2 family DNA or RNA helicase
MEQSPKIQALLRYAYIEMNSGKKMVIFSQWTSHLDLIGAALNEAGHHCCRIDGSMNSDERVNSMRRFESDGCESTKSHALFFVLFALAVQGST